MNFLALDCEFNQDQENRILNPKLIQIGVSVGSTETGEILETVKFYIDPYEPIFPFITQLTGITDEDIKEKSIQPYQAATELSAIIKQYDSFVNPVTWGGGDASAVVDLFRDYKVQFPHFGHRIIDIKTMYVMDKLVNGKKPSGGLSSALGYYGLQFKGQAHRADVDAENTMNLFLHMFKRHKFLVSSLNAGKEFKV